MHISIKIEVHAYAEEKLCDESFDDAPFYGINGPEIMLPLNKIRDQILLLILNPAHSATRNFGQESPDLFASLSDKVRKSTER